MDKAIIKKIVIISVLSIIIAGLALYFYLIANKETILSTTQNKKPVLTSEPMPPFFKDNNFEISKPSLWVDIDPNLLSNPFFDKIREDFKIKTQWTGTVSRYKKCFVRIAEAETDGDFIKKATLYKEKIFSDPKNKLLKEEGFNPESFFVFFKFLNEETSIETDVRIYRADNKMYFIVAHAQIKPVSGPVLTFEEQCKIFSEEIPELVKISDAQ